MFFFFQNSGTHAADNALQIGFPQTLPLLRKAFQRPARTFPIHTSLPLRQQKIAGNSYEGSPPEHSPAEKRLFLQVAENEMECLNSAPPAAVRALDRRDPSAGRPGMRFRRENQSSISHPLRLTGRFSQVGSPVLLAKVHLTGSQSKLASYT